MGLVLYLVDKYATHKKNVGQFYLKDAILVGLSQSLAIIPGISRSGATITAGLSLGYDRVNAAKISFLLSAPIIFGATIIKVPHLLKSGLDGSLLIGILFSAMSGFLAIKYLLQLIEKASYAVFFWYRLVLAIVIVAFFLLR
jgi:undecaprenyl-diphosphatase